MTLVEIKYSTFTFLEEDVSNAAVIIPIRQHEEEIKLSYALLLSYCTQVVDPIELYHYGIGII